ncbi:beta-L-arabinofuranosidase domain-containing protein [Kiritimatiella glycovorans]|nr:beta-L-arabinofuranosidase domain-containing protein [Kiritimatiella glycovorans]
MCAAAMVCGAPECPVYEPLLLREIQPRGWMAGQLRNDALRGVAGNLQKVRPQYTPATWVHKTGSAGAAELTGNWLDGYTRMAYYGGYASERSKVNRYVREILDAQEPSGYVGNMPADLRWKRLNRDLFNESRTGVALLAYYEMTGEQEALDAVIATADVIMANYNEDNPPFIYQPGDENYRAEPVEGEEGADDFVDDGDPAKPKPRKINGHVLMYVDVCEWLYRLTGEKKYVEYAEFLYRQYSESNDIGPDDIKLDVLLDPEIPLEGHGAHVAEHFRVPFFLACATGKDIYYKASQAALEKFSRFRTPSGALVSDEGVHGQMPLPEQGYEYCATTEMTASLASALQKFGNPEVGDWIEWLVFNAAQGARTPDGTMINYLSAATVTRAKERMNLGYPHNSNGRWHYSPAHQVGGSCCTANAVKLMPYYVGSMWMRSADGAGLAALLLGPSEVRTRVGGVLVTIREETGYPFEDRVRFHFETAAPVEFPFEVRIPGWAGSVETYAPRAAVTEGKGRKIFRKKWRTGDTVELKFGHPVRLRECVNGEVAIARGPLLYAQPLPAEKKVLKKSRGGVPEFTEWELLPESGEPAAPWSIAPINPDAGFKAVENPAYDPERPWAHPRWFLEGPLYLRRGKGAVSRLKPLGSTFLRQAAFPVRRDVSPP